ncbi:MAG: FkbM family methyltransferase, partial [Gaiellaceae bacterium]
VSRLRGWLVDLEERIAAELDRFGECTLSPAYPHPHPSTYDLEPLVAGVEPERPGSPSIVLSVRDDRLWGKDAAAQERNVAALWTRIAAAFPEAACTAVGVGGETALPEWVSDLRAAAPDEALERRWLALMRGADLAIGVHGSNLLLPSGLAAATVELVGEERYGNVFQDTLLAGTDPLAALGRHRLLYGDAELTDVAPERVAALAVSVLHESERFTRLMTGPAAGQGGGAVPHIAASKAPAQPEAPRLRPSPVRLLRRVAGKAAARRHRPTPLPEAPTVLTDRRGLRFELVTAEEIEQFVLNDGHFEAAEIELAASYLRPGMTAVDVGANIGAFTAAFARAVWPGGSVHAFEPLTAARERLARTLELNGLEGVHVNDLAVSDANGEAPLYDYGTGFESWAGLAPRSIGFEDRVVAPVTHVDVPTTTLDAYAARAGLDRIDLLKIDVEGAEEGVLRGASGLLAAGAVAAILLEVSDNTLEAFGSRAADVIDLLSEHGLRTFVLRDGRLRGFRVAGEFRELANVFALSPAARERLLEWARFPSSWPARCARASGSSARSRPAPTAAAARAYWRGSSTRS